MLYFVTNSREYTWRTGSKLPVIEETITEVQADGYELECIRLKFSGAITDTQGPAQTWRDIEARVIYLLMCKGL